MIYPPTYYVASEAAKAFARTIDHDHDDIAEFIKWSECSHAAAFDAGVAHEAATRSPRVLTTAAELVPASESVPEPVRLTDADDERIKPGALVAYDSTPEPDGTWTTYRHRLISGNSGSVNTAAYVREQIRLGNSCYSLLSEAAPDPDADRVAVVVEWMGEHGITTSNSRDLLARLDALRVDQ